MVRINAVKDRNDVHTLHSENATVTHASTDEELTRVFALAKLVEAKQQREPIDWAAEAEYWGDETRKWTEYTAPVASEGSAEDCD